MWISLCGVKKWFVSVDWGIGSGFWAVEETFILQSVSKKTTHLGLENTQQKQRLKPPLSQGKIDIFHRF